MMRCEVCEKPATHVCSGLDVPELGFCRRHAVAHRKDCDYVRLGIAAVVEMGKPVAAQAGRDA